MTLAEKILALSSGMPANSTVAERLNNVSSVEAIILVDEYILELEDAEFTLFLDDLDFIIEIDYTDYTVEITG